MDAVRIAYGRVGTGFPLILREMKTAHAQGMRTMLLVPEQYTLQAERDLMDGLGLPGLLNMDVVSPTGLKRLIREKGGHSAAEPMNAAGRAMILSYLLTQHKNQLQYYRSVYDTPSLPQQLSSLLQEMQEAGMDPAQMGRLSQDQQQPACAAKMADIQLIWQSYQQMVEGQFADEAAQWADALAHADDSRLFHGIGLWVYGFDLLTPPLVQLLAAQAKHMASLTFTFTLDRTRTEDGRLFRTGEKSVKQLTECLQANGISYLLLPQPSSEGMASHAKALQYVEQHLFGHTSIPFEGDASPVTLCIASTPFQEATWCTATLLKWHQQGIPWSRMAVALGSSNLYGDMAVNLSMAGIPHYLGEKVPAARHGLCRFLSGALRAATMGYQQDDMLYLLKSGFSPLRDEEAQRLDIYVREQGIHRKKWLTPFHRGSQAEEMEPLRQRLIAPLEQLQQKLRNARSASESAAAIYQLLITVESYDKLLKREEDLLNHDMPAQASQNRQVWRLLMNLLDQLHTLLGSKRALMADIAAYITAGIEAASISGLPPAPDAVMVGEAGHLMTGSLDGLVLMGAQDTLLQRSADSLLTPQERRLLEEQAGRTIGHDREILTALRMADIYRTVTLPAKMLVFSCATGTQNGSALRESSLLLRLRLLFPQMDIQGGAMGMPSADAPLSPLHALDSLPLRMQAWRHGHGEQMPPPWQDAFLYLQHQPSHQAQITRMTDALDGMIRNTPLSPDTAHALFPMDSASISRLETYAACPYQHFVSYGLRPLILRPYEYAADERGTFFHEALSQFVQQAMSHSDWPNLSDEAVHQVADQVLLPLKTQWESGPLGDDPIGEIMGAANERIVHTACHMITRQAANSNFTTWCTEVAFGYPDGLPPIQLQLAEGRTMTLRGRIDRIDLYEGAAGEFVRVVDYKSSNKQLDATRVWHGLQLQLLLYLAVASHGFPGSTPAGAYYFSLKDQLTESSDDLKDAVEKLLAREMQLKGITLRDLEVVNASDRDEPGLSLGVMLKKDDSFRANSRSVSPAGMDALINTAKTRAQELASVMVKGDISISPAQVEGDPSTPCTYCHYAGICGQDPTLTGWAPRIFAKTTMAQFDPQCVEEADAAQ